jgi:hypothetical protein
MKEDYAYFESKLSEEKTMPRYSYLLALITFMFYVGVASAQESYPMLDKLAQKVIQKYQTTSCEQLALEKSQPPTGRRAEIEQRVIDMMRNDPKMRAAFINQVAGPIANKMFECGMIP